LHGLLPAQTSQFAFVRYNSDGSLDASFGTGGRAVTDLASAYYA
jgi:hypothetical protein